MEPDLAPLGTFTLTQLGYVVAVDTHRHFGRAAEACHVTQPTLSMQIGKLERALGVSLFDRGRAPIVPTEVGRAIVEQARLVLREAARVIEVRDATVGDVAGEIRLGVIPTLAPYLLPRAVHALARAHPRLVLVVEERVTDDLLDAVRRGALDGGVVATPPNTGDLSERVLFSEPFVGYVSAGHRLAARATLVPADLSLDDLWLLAEGHCFRAQTVELCAQRSPRGGRAAGAPAAGAPAVGTRFESGNLETLKALVERGVGMTLLPALAAAQLRTDDQRALLRPFADPAPSRDVRLVRRRTLPRQRLVDTVADALVAARADVLRDAAPPGAP